jgi:hypothetical protein
MTKTGIFPWLKVADAETPHHKKDPYLGALSKVAKHLNRAGAAAEDSRSITVLCAIKEAMATCAEFQQRRLNALQKPR